VGFTKHGNELAFTKRTPAQHNMYNINTLYLLQHILVFVHHHQGVYTNIFEA